ncbi:hypothetical protein AUA12_24875 [Salmonella enterica subsp. arizonae serovar 18:z4,z23:-]|uniref:Uncharacterized protein n=1 Tax=Salmonella enterica subsp. arizonae serovar 18:z4,z23:- TaxID=1192839 RepID=A0A5W0NZR2_SALER|nr:hypothetical protein [Salmonella enterica]EBV7594608.1 hypothetical protein [Salmonella enterica subsp. enterica serovar Hadar]EBV9409834.1 hypothetical protein [Salmonella enterica subsp. arizonae serovar 18:z4,z23:-]EBV7862066.1 hypothetical protein [Salmonella enterica subsp. enterica serovar Hadar]EBV7862274.1 hypothetical protein [Salmonella enterica subsp. enterica serovar Hadar]
MKLQYRIPLAIYSVWCIIAILLCKDGLYQMNIWTLVEILGMIALPLLVRPFFILGNDSNLLIVFYVQIMPDDFVMQLHRF